MSLPERLTLAFFVAGLITFDATPRAIALANRLQFHDKPAGYKGHATPTPYLGGAAVMAGFVVALAVAAGHWDKTGALLGGAALLWLVGTIDDRRPLPAAPRAAIELALGGLVYAAGLGWHLHAGGALDLALTCLWVLAVVNAFNLFDNMDGAAATMALVVCGGAALVGVVRGDVWLASGATALCGACLGFLPRNLSTPARIFLGDGGSMPVGFAAAVFVMVAAGTTTVAWRSLLVALLLVAVPALDTTLVIVSRRRRGVSILSGGRDHLTHRTRRYLPSARAVALALGVAQAALSVLAVLTSRGDSTLLVISASLYVLVAGCVIVALDTQEIEEFDVQAAGKRLYVSKRAAACLLVLGLGAGISPLFYAYFDASVWVPIGLALTLLCAIALVIRPIRPGLPAALSVGGALGLGLWSLVSSAWAESVSDAIVSANRWLAYGALLALLVVLIAHPRPAAALLGAVTLGITIVAATVLVRMLADDPGSLFLGGRLNSPLGYINGEGCLFAMAIWPLLAAAESRRALIAGPAAALATVMASLAILSQSRGTALAVAGALLAVLALAPGRTRRAYAALVIGAAVALAGPDLLNVYGHSSGGSVVGSDVHAAARATLLSAFVAGIAWGSLSALESTVAARVGRPRGARIAGSGLLVLATLVLVLALASAHAIERDVDRQWHAFTHLAEPGESAAPASSTARSRLLSGAGNRYDYWRIAWRLWQDDPLVGAGAGNYARTYYEQRATTEDVEQPHSLELEVLSELGVVGALLLACLLGGVAWGTIRMRRTAARSPVERVLLVGALGVFVAWLVQASVDWMALLPGLTAIALSAGAVLVWPRGVPRALPVAGASGASPIRAGRAVLGLGASAVIVTLIVAGASLSRQGLADLYRSDAQRELAHRPLAALRDVERSLEVDGSSVQAYYIKAAALARFDEGDAAEAALNSALRREPRNFVTWVLLGDVAVRRHDLAAASARYRRAHELNPRDPAIARLGRTPPARLQTLAKA
jgi:UDP-N-acetylmuramyl pentapeptide phosphotransferase/UDP-N-acetylglucosamine-1-phosphate transferase/tetratricopeptide (TPR) repeat protein